MGRFSRGSCTRAWLLALTWALAPLLLRCTLLTSTDGLAGDPGSADAQADVGVRAVDAGDADAPRELPGLLGYWAFEERDGNVVADLSGHGHPGTIVGTPARIAGTRGQALAFSGNGQRVEIPSLQGANAPQSGTLSVWLKHDYQGATADLIFGDFEGMADHVRIQTSVGELKLQVIFQVRQPDSSFASTFFTKPKMLANTWQHLVVTWDSDKRVGASYVDGTAYSDAWTVPSWSPRDQDFTLARKLSGAIDEVRLYGRPLSADEITSVP